MSRYECADITFENLRAGFRIDGRQIMAALLTPDWKVFGAIFLITHIPLAVKLLIRKD